MDKVVNTMTMIGANRKKWLDAAEESMIRVERKVDKLGEAIIRLLWTMTINSKEDWRGLRGPAIGLRGGIPIFEFPAFLSTRPMSDTSRRCFLLWIHLYFKFVPSSSMFFVFGKRDVKFLSEEVLPYRQLRRNGETNSKKDFTPET